MFISQVSLWFLDFGSRNTAHVHSRKRSDGLLGYHEDGEAHPRAFAHAFCLPRDPFLPLPILPWANPAHPWGMSI